MAEEEHRRNMYGSFFATNVVHLISFFGSFVLCARRFVLLAENYSNYGDVTNRGEEIISSTLGRLRIILRSESDFWLDNILIKYELMAFLLLLRHFSFVNCSATQPKRIIHLKCS